MGPNITIKNVLNSLPKYSLNDDEITINIYPRIHFFSLDLSNNDGFIRHGSMGCSIKEAPIFVKISKSFKDKICSNIDISKIDNKINFTKIRDFLNVNNSWNVKIETTDNAIKNHVGIGLSTQIECAILWGCAMLSNKKLNIVELYRYGIGRTSTLGLKLFFNPGLIIEFGLKTKNDIDTTIYNIENFPFNIDFFIPKNEHSLSGEFEDKFWSKILPTSVLNSYKISYDILYKLIPSIINIDFNNFCNTINKINSISTKKYEEAIQSKNTIALIDKCRQISPATTISSMGPTTYLFTKKDTKTPCIEYDNSWRHYRYE